MGKVEIRDEKRPTIRRAIDPVADDALPAAVVRNRQRRRRLRCITQVEGQRLQGIDLDLREQAGAGADRMR